MEDIIELRYCQNSFLAKLENYTNLKHRIIFRFTALFWHRTQIIKIYILITQLEHQNCGGQS